MAELEAVRGGSGHEEEPARQLAEDRPHDVHRLAGHPGEGVDPEIVADHRRHADERLGRVRQIVDPPQDCLVEGVRDVGRANGVAIRPMLIEDDAEELLDMQGIAIRPLVQRLDHLSGRRLISPEDQPGHRGGVGHGQPRQLDDLRELTGQETRSPFAHRHARVELIAAIRPDHDHRQLRQPPCEPGEDLEAQLVDIGQVLDRDQGRFGRGRGQDVDHVEDHLSTVSPAVRLRLRLERMQARP